VEVTLHQGEDNADHRAKGGRLPSLIGLEDTRNALSEIRKFDPRSFPRLCPLRGRSGGKASVSVDFCVDEFGTNLHIAVLN
jgi:hypothetical protein